MRHALRSSAATSDRAGGPTYLPAQSGRGATARPCSTASLSPPRILRVRLAKRFSIESISGDHQLGLDGFGIGNRVDLAFDMGDIVIIQNSAAQWAMASTSRILAKNWLPKPSPLLARAPDPAMSTKVIRVGMISFDLPDLGQLEQSRIGHSHIAHIGFDGAERGNSPPARRQFWSAR